MPTTGTGGCGGSYFSGKCPAALINFSRCLGVSSNMSAHFRGKSFRARKLFPLKEFLTRARLLNFSSSPIIDRHFAHLNFFSQSLIRKSKCFLIFIKEFRKLIHYKSNLMFLLIVFIEQIKFYWILFNFDIFISRFYAFLSVILLSFIKKYSTIPTLNIDILF